MKLPLPSARSLSSALVALSAVVACTTSGCGTASGAPPTPAGYWEGSVTTKEVPKKTPNMTMTREVEAEFWFTVEWDKTRNIGIVSGEADAKYDAELKVDNLPKVTAPVPGGSVKFEPNVGGKLTDTDNRRKFPIVGVLSVDPATGKGTLILQKGAVVDTRSESERLDDEAKGNQGPDATMEFTLRADPGVSGGLSGAAGSVNVGSDGTVTAEAGGVEQSANVGGGNGNVIVKKIPMKPFDPFTSTPGQVEKRRGGPFAASFEEKGDNYSVKWSAKQMGGEKVEPSELTPEMREQIEQLIEQLNRRR
jgi:hypothetical protein